MSATTLASAEIRTAPIYLWLAGACAVFAFGGFAATYWLQLAAGTFVGGTPLLHLHALLFSAWTLLLVSQAWLGRQGKLDHHRAWGVAGVSLATAMLFVGLALALRSVEHYLADGHGDAARAFFMLPFQGLFLFAIFFVAALATLARPDWHKRLLIVATVVLLPAAAARIGFLIATGGGPGARPGLAPPPPVALGINGALMAGVILLAGIVYDWRTRGRPHPAYLVGLASLLGTAIAGTWLSGTGVWMGFVDALRGFAG